MGSGRQMPATLTSAASGPSSCSMRLAKGSCASRSATSSSYPVTPSAGPTGSMSAAATRNPSSRSRNAMARPMPLAAPVTIATGAAGSTSRSKRYSILTVKLGGPVAGSRPGIRESVVHGWPAVHLTSDLLEVTVLPSKGADIYALTDLASGIDPLFKAPWGLQPPGSPPRSGSDGAAFLANYEGGWQELFPNTNDPASYHGT